MKYQYVIAFMISLAALMGETRSLASEADTRYYRDVLSGVSIEFTGPRSELKEENLRIVTSLSQELRSIAGHAFFKNRLPKSWGIFVDGNPRTSDGYFSTSQKTRDGAPAILIQRGAALAPSGSKGLLTHEITHLVHFATRPQEEVWVKEGIALLAEYIVTGVMSRALLEGFVQPETSLVVGYDLNHRTQEDKSLAFAQYGHALQYFYYLYRLCGKLNLIEPLLNPNSHNTGVKFINEILPQMEQSDPVCASFEKSFIAFEKARFFPQIVPSSTYVFPQLKGAAGNALGGDLPPYSARSYKKTGECKGGAEAIGPDFCFQVRLQ